MNFTAKLSLISIASILTASAFVGGGTFAFFSSSVQNNKGNFTSGHLNITPERFDIPQSGPMFYSKSTSTLPGALATGQWAPGDQHTRGLFLENTGSLKARLKYISASPVNSAGMLLSSNSIDQTAYQNDLNFAKQSQVIVWKVVPVTSSGTIGDWPSGESASEIEETVDQVNASYQQVLAQGESVANDMPGFLAIMNTNLLHDVNNITAISASGTILNNDSVKIVDAVSVPLISLLQNPLNVSTELKDTLLPGSDIETNTNVGQSTLLTFTVHFDKSPPANSGVNPNSMQGKSVYFNFGTNWVQTRNNPLPSSTTTSVTVQGGL